MNGQHWTDYSEAELAAMRARPQVRASRPSRGVAPAAANTAAAEPAYPAEWLPELAARSAVRATTPAEWMEENAPDPHVHRNGTAPAGSPSSEAYPAEWLSQADLAPGRGGLGGEGWINRRAA